jgi:hypothetical protein
MNSLRRDLLERKLWPVVVILLLAIVAVPFVLRKHASADVTLAPAPPAAIGTAPASREANAARLHALEVSLPRNPFASGMPKLNAKPASQTKSSSASASPSTAGTSASSTSGPASMVSPSPTTSSSGSSPGSSASSGSSASTPGTPASAGSSPTVTTTTTVTVPSTTLAGPQWAVGAADPAWTIFSVALRFGADDSAPVRSDVARLTPLPSVAQPRVMFMGVLDGGQQAVFALGAGVQHAGPGLCRPNRARCAAIVLRSGQTEQINVAGTHGAPSQQLRLSLASISSRVTHSRQEALASFNRHSAAGLCELDLADPVTYSQTDGTLAAVASASDCKGQKRTVPFPGSLVAP